MPCSLGLEVTHENGVFLGAPGAEPAEWDLLIPPGEKLDGAARTVLPLRLYLEEIRSHFPMAVLKTLNGTGHWLHAEKPGEFFEISLDFLNS